MMCLGWANQTQCKNGREQLEMESAPATACGDISWFWISAAVIGFFGLSGNKTQRTR